MGKSQKKLKLPPKNVAMQIDAAARAAASHHMIKVERQLHQIARMIVGEGLPMARRKKVS